MKEIIEILFLKKRISKLINYSIDICQSWKINKINNLTDRHFMKISSYLRLFENFRGKKNRAEGSLISKIWKNWRLFKLSNIPAHRYLLLQPSTTLHILNKRNYRYEFLVHEPESTNMVQYSTKFHWDSRHCRK